MKTFRIMGNNTRFALERSFKSAGCIPAVSGISMDGKTKALAAESDIVWLDDFRYVPAMAPDELGRYAIHDGQEEQIVDRVQSIDEAQQTAMLMNLREILLNGLVNISN